MSNIKTLKPFKPGHPGGPGRPKNPPALKEIQQMTKGEYVLLMHKLINLKPDELANFKGTILEMAMASIIQKAIKEGDDKRLTYFTDRLFGKVKEQVEMEVTGHLDGKTEQEKLEAVKEAVKVLEAKQI